MNREKNLPYSKYLQLPPKISNTIKVNSYNINNTISQNQIYYNDAPKKVPYLSIDPYKHTGYVNYTLNNENKFLSPKSVN